MQRPFVLAVVAAALLVAASAGAQPAYPGVVKDHLGAIRKPACRVCHGNGITGLGTVNTYFGINLVKFGGTANDDASIRQALDKFRELKTDSTKFRGTPDVDVLKAGGDPNDVVPVPLIEEPQYGCGATFTGRRDLGRTGVVVVAFVLGAAFSRLWRNRGRRPCPCSERR